MFDTIKREWKSWSHQPLTVFACLEAGSWFLAYSMPSWPTLVATLSGGMVCNMSRAKFLRQAKGITGCSHSYPLALRRAHTDVVLLLTSCKLTFFSHERGTTLF
jgi:hypothetical protein